MNEKAWITDSDPSERFPFYTRANVGEIAPRPMTPLSWKLVWEKGVVPGMHDGHFRWGSFTPDELQGNNTSFSCFGGYLYINWSMARVQGERSPGMSAQVMDDAYFGQIEVPKYEAIDIDKSPEAEERIQRTIDSLMAADELPPELAEDRLKAINLRKERPNLLTSTDLELVEHALSLSSIIREFFEPYMVFGTAPSLALALLPGLCDGLDPSVPGRLISGVGNVDSVPPSFAIWELSRLVRSSDFLSSEFDTGVDDLLVRLELSEEGKSFLTSLESVREEHGARGPGEWDMASPSWETKPDLLLSLVERLRFADDELSPENRHANVIEDTQKAISEVRKHLGENSESLATLDLVLRLAELYVVARERTKLTEMMVVHEIRVAIDELGKRMVKDQIIVAPEDICMLIDTELKDFVSNPSAFIEIISSRKKRFNELEERQEPFILFQETPNPDLWPMRLKSAEPISVGEKIDGVPGAPGIAIGRARVIADPSDPRGLEPGEILVANITDPAWTPLFLPSAGVIVEIGAPLSHAMILSRELGVPCVTGIVGASLRIKDGMLLEINGNTGSVTVLESE